MLHSDRKGPDVITEPVGNFEIKILSPRFVIFIPGTERITTIFN